MRRNPGVRRLCGGGIVAIDLEHGIDATARNRVIHRAPAKQLAVEFLAASRSVVASSAQQNEPGG